MNSQLVTFISRTPDPVRESYYRPDAMLESLRRFGEVPVNLCADGKWQGLMSKPFALRDWLRRGDNTSDRLIVTDAFDVLFIQHPHGIGDRCIEYFGRDTIVCNGETALWPCGDLAEFFPDTGPRRFLNSGVMIGPSEKILALLEDMNLESIGVDRKNPDGSWNYPNDQGEFQKMFARQYQPATCFDQRPYKMVVDGSCRLAMTFSATEPTDYDLVAGELRCNLTGTKPGILHLNGDGQNRHFSRIAEFFDLP